MLDELTVDIESRSACDLPRAGAGKYARDPSTSIICIGYQVNDGPRKLWIPERAPMPKDFKAAMINGIMVAHNAGFERNMFRHCLIRYPLLTYDEVLLIMARHDPKYWKCTAAKAAGLTYPRALKNAAPVIGVKTAKDLKGHRTMLKVSQPRTPSKNNPDVWWDGKDDLRLIYKYCLTDVRVEREIDKAIPDLSPSEQRIWELNEKINDRGVLIDVPMVKLILKLLDEEKANVRTRVSRLTKGEITDATQTAKVLQYINKYGTQMKNLQAETIRDTLERDDLHPNVRLMLEYRTAASKTSTSKYTSMLEAVDDDCRARELIMYCGAATTKRFSGQRLQVQNFVKPAPYLQKMGFKSDEAIEIIKKEGLNGIRKKYGETSVMDVFAACTRGMLIPTPGSELYCADFSAVEARLAFWLSDCTSGVEAFRSGSKIYEEMAADTFGMRIEDVTKDGLERFVGKESVLGCLSKGTPILTENGFKAIELIGLGDKLWNGQKWVKHGGVVAKGWKHVILIENQKLKATPDHWFLKNDMWQTSVEISLNADTQPRQLELLMGEQLSFQRNLKKVPSAVSLCAAYVELKKHYESIFFTRELGSHVKNVHKELIAKRVDKKETETSWLIQNLESVGLHVSTILNIDVETLARKTSRGMEVAVLNSNLKPLEIFWNTLLHCAGLINGDSPWTELIMTNIMSVETYESLVNELIIGIEPTFDILNVEEGNRFQASTIIAHNCQYGMGAAKFLKQCHKKGMKMVTPKIAKRAVDAYRNKYFEIPEAWGAIEQAAIAAVQYPGQIFKAAKCSFEYDEASDFLLIETPLGDYLRYASPSVANVKNHWGHTQPTLYHYAWDFGMDEDGKMRKKWTQVKTWGGVIFNNIIQKTSRDLMCRGIRRIEKAGYKFLLSIHDEALAEIEIGKGDVQEFIDLLCGEMPEALSGAPLRAEGWVGKRYRK